MADIEQQRQALGELVYAAHALIGCGVQTGQVAPARELAKRFKGGRAARRLVLEFGPDQAVRVTFELLGRASYGDRPLRVEIFSLQASEKDLNAA